MSTEYYVAWWNLENLFDVEDAPLERRPDKVRRAIGDDIKAWTAAKLDRKVDQLAGVIAQMNAGAGPDLLGVCEVENRFVLPGPVGREPPRAIARSRVRRGARRYG